MVNYVKTFAKILTSSDFDENGVATYYLLQPAAVTTSVCHTTDIYQGTKKIN